MRKIIFFDIDGTLFDVSFFINLLHKRLIDRFDLTDQDIMKLQILYAEVKKENGYFLPSSFLSKIMKHFPSVDEKGLEEIFYSIDLFEKSVYKDTPVIKSLANLAVLGVFSQGEENFQKRKIAFLKGLLNDSDIYIFPNKFNQIKQVFGKYDGYEVFLVDDNIDLLIRVKSVYSNISTVLIDRDGRFGDNKDITKIKNLNELNSII